MKLGTKLVSVAATAALVAGAGAMAAVPATAAGKGPQPKGTTVINVPTTLITQAGAAGVQIAPILPATADATMDTVGVAFPVTGPITDGAVSHRGGLSLTTSKIALTLSNPVIGWATDGDGKSGTISGTVGGVPAGSGFEQLNGQSVPVFDVKNMQITSKKGKPVGKGKVWKRTTTQTITGDVSVVDNPAVVDIINGLLGVPLFKAGMPFGTLDTTWSVTINCKSKKACS